MSTELNVIISANTAPLAEAIARAETQLEDSAKRMAEITAKAASGAPQQVAASIKSAEENAAQVAAKAEASAKQAAETQAKQAAALAAQAEREAAATAKRLAAAVAKAAPIPVKEVEKVGTQMAAAVQQAAPKVEKAGVGVAQQMAIGVVKGMAMVGVGKILGGSLLSGMQAINQGKDVGSAMAKAVIDGAKTFPVVGTFVSFFEEIVVGAEREALRLEDVAKQASKIAVDTAKETMLAIRSFTEATAGISDARAASVDPMKALELTDIEATKKDIADVEALKTQAQKDFKAQSDMIRAQGEARGDFDVNYGGADRDRRAESQSTKETKAAKEKLRAILAQIDSEAQERQLQRDRDFDAKEKKIQDASAQSEIDTAKKTADTKQRILEQSEQLYDRFVEGNIQDAERANLAAQKVQQDIIDNQNAAQAQTSKVGRLDEMARSAAGEMIHSGQTAIGQFNFGEQNAGAKALDMATKQVRSLEAIEKATAEQVRLAKEMGGFR